MVLVTTAGKLARKSRGSLASGVKRCGFWSGIRTKRPMRCWRPEPTAAGRGSEFQLGVNDVGVPWDVRMEVSEDIADLIGSTLPPGATVVIANLPVGELSQVVRIHGGPARSHSMVKARWCRSTGPSSS